MNKKAMKRNRALSICLLATMLLSLMSPFAVAAAMADEGDYICGKIEHVHDMTSTTNMMNPATTVTAIWFVCRRAERQGRASTTSTMSSATMREVSWSAPSRSRSLMCIMKVATPTQSCRIRTKERTSVSQRVMARPSNPKVMGKRKPLMLPLSLTDSPMTRKPAL